MIGRALTDEDKDAVIARVLAAWKKAPQLRLGQLVVNAVSHKTDVTADVFVVEDDALADACERFAGVR